ncbi:MAG: diguanylate cyclase domain-containing protein [Tepidibacillus sp.]
MFAAFFEDMTLIISYIYIFNKMKDFIINKNKKWERMLTLFAPIVGGILSISVMIEPLVFNKMEFDLRAIPIFIVAYVGGMKLGVVSAALPVSYRFLMGGDAVWQGLASGILLPMLIGGLFHPSSRFRPRTMIINIKRELVVYTIYIIVDFVIGLFQDIPMDRWIEHHILLAAFSWISISTITLMLNDSSRQYLYEKELKYLSTHDELTNLPNRRYYQRKLKKLKGNENPIGVAMVDVDYFKQYNDTFGHVAGDLVLKKVAEIMSDHIRKEEGFVARYGGEEFIIFFKKVDRSEMNIILERIRSFVEQYPFQGVEKQPNGRLTISIGVSFADLGETVDQLIEEADQALYNSKENGRNRITFYKDYAKLKISY